jgi:hypothetical protein
VRPVVVSSTVVSRTTPCKPNSATQHSRLLLLVPGNIDPEKGAFARGDGL